MNLQNTKHIGITHLGVADVNEDTNGATQIAQRMQLDLGLGKVKKVLTQTDPDASR